MIVTAPATSIKTKKVVKSDPKINQLACFTEFMSKSLTLYNQMSNQILMYSSKGAKNKRLRYTYK